MAALATQNVHAGGAVTTAAAAAGGDTIEAGTQAGGWSSPVFLLAVVGATATTITVQGVAYGPYTSQTVVIPVANIYRGRRVAITYSQVTAVTVGAISTAPLGVVTV
jgi:phage tail tube protein FII